MRSSGRGGQLARRRGQGWRLRSAMAGTVLGLVASALAAAGTAGPASAAATPMVTAGGGYSCALVPSTPPMPGGAVWCWGRNTTGQLGDGSDTDSMVPVSVALPAVAGVSAGHDHTCAVNTANQVWCWGADAFGELGDGTTKVQGEFPEIVPGVLATQVSAGDGHTCAVTLAQTVECWGDNNFGELGDGTTADASTPQPVTGLTNVIQVAAGSFHTCALESDGTVWCWGDGSSGALGNGTRTGSDVPEKVGLENATFVAAGFADSCAIISGGDLRCWGNNSVGQLGAGNFKDHLVPVQTVGLTSGTGQVTMGQDFSCALVTTSVTSALCWGDADGHGQLGNGSFNAQLPVPTPVFGLVTSPTGLATGPVQIAAGAHHACVELVSGPVDCWGEGFYGDLGDGSSLDHALPTQTIGLPGSAGGVESVSAGIVTGCAVTAALRVACWGQDAGDGSPLATIHTSATGVLGLPAGGASQVSAAFGACALVLLGGLKTNVLCWGDNSRGELGDKTTIDRTQPVKVKGLTSAVSVTTGGRHACALLRGGGADCWGANGNGQLGDGTTSESHVPVAVQGLPARLAQIAAGGTHTCGLLIDGTVWCWGSGGDGELGNGSTSDSSTPVMVTGLPSVVQIAVGGNLLGGDSTCALTSAGTVFCWGDNNNGELGNGTTTNSDVPVGVTGLSSSAVAVTQTAGVACVALVTGQVDCWGDNSVGQLGDGVSGGMTTSPVMVSGLTTGGTSINESNGSSTCALDLTQQAQCWGWNVDGQLGDGSTANSDVPVPVSGL
jgi:alpha-tubulin suppressor-like RCC1 family protein